MASQINEQGVRGEAVKCGPPPKRRIRDEESDEFMDTDLRQMCIEKEFNSLNKNLSCFKSGFYCYQ